MQGSLFYVAGGIREVQRFLDTPVYPERPFGAIEFTGIRTALRLEGLGYTYGTGTQALRDVSFEVRAGQTVAIVGSSGSGKSTLASLLLRLRAPTAGRITVDGVDYWQFSAESWHRSISLVEQDAFLFHGTLGENVLYGWPHVTAGALDHAIAAANLTDMVASLPAGLDTLVGERGAMVSGGQRQRIAIARAIVRDPGILVLDEATSHLDSVSEQLVQQALSNAARGRTTIVIAHRLSTIRDADWIVVFEQGRIVEQGTWTSLQAAKGTFDRLVLALTARSGPPINRHSHGAGGLAGTGDDSGSVGRLARNSGAPRCLFLARVSLVRPAILPRLPSGDDQPLQPTGPSVPAVYADDC